MNKQKKAPRKNTEGDAGDDAGDDAVDGEE
jgi:hypothetical protein